MVLVEEVRTVVTERGFDEVFVIVCIIQTSHETGKGRLSGRRAIRGGRRITEIEFRKIEHGEIATSGVHRFRGISRLLVEEQGSHIVLAELVRIGDLRTQHHALVVRMGHIEVAVRSQVGRIYERILVQRIGSDARTALERIGQHFVGVREGTPRRVMVVPTGEQAQFQTLHERNRILDVS